jgi:glycosyltransferase involved in cell wall biosynthesis
LEIQKRTIFIKTSPANRDPRLQKELDTITQAGYDTLLLFWNREGDILEKTDNIRKEIIYMRQAPYGIGILPYLPIWWLFEFYSLLREDFDVIHAINLDTAFPAIMVSKIKKRPLIYEVYDTYADMNAPVPTTLRKLGIYIEKLAMYLADAVIIVDESRITEVNGIPNKNINILYNSPRDLADKSDLKSIEKDKDFTLFYAGLLTDGRSICEVIRSILTLEGVSLIIAGFGDFADRIEIISKKYPNKIKFIGKISHNEVLKNSLLADMLFSIYDPEIPLYRFASSNKLFEAMMLSKPILVSENTSMADIVIKENCGLVVPSKNVEYIQKAILKLKSNPDLGEKLGKNGRIAYEKSYNWDEMSRRLINIYNNL